MPDNFRDSLFLNAGEQELAGWMAQRRFEPPSENLALRITSQARPFPVAVAARPRAAGWLPAWLTQREVMAYGLAMALALYVGFQVSPQETPIKLDPFQVAGGQLTQQGSLY